MKRIYLLLILCLLANGVAFSDEEKQGSYGKNTITIDALFLIPTLIVWSVTDFENNFVMTALQYERQLSDTISIAARLGYKGYYFDDSTISAISAEMHFRHYPNIMQDEENTFFLDWMAGYSYVDFEEKDDYVISHIGLLGFKMGWRIGFNQPRGFILEPSAGYYLPFGKPNARKDDNNTLIKEFIAGGFQFSLCMGYRF